jgi:hypothetical protein
MSQRFTGNAATQATASANASEPQKSRSPSPASIAPGIARRTRLSTISMTVIDTVSAANAIPSAAPSGSPDLSTGRSVSA